MYYQKKKTIHAPQQRFFATPIFNIAFLAKEIFVVNIAV